MNETNTTPASHNGHEYIDLGLPSGTLWATCNVGANSPEEYGDHFAWGETEPKEYYYGDTYKFSIDGALSRYNKYNDDDEKVELDLEDDVANVLWGGNWHIPSNDDFQELQDNCEWDWDDNKKGFVITADNGNTIFLPPAGARTKDDISAEGEGGMYSTNRRDIDSGCACVLSCLSDYTIDPLEIPRFIGFSIRPVFKP